MKSDSPARPSRSDESDGKSGVRYSRLALLQVYESFTSIFEEFCDAEEPTEQQRRAVGAASDALNAATRAFIDELPVQSRVVSGDESEGSQAEQEKEDKGNA